MRNRGLKSGRGRGSGAARKCSQSSDFLELFSNGDSRCGGSYKRRKQEQRPEVNFVAARSSINQLYDVLYNFDEMKKDIVRSIGFGGLLYFPPIRQVNRRFAVWLMSKVDPLAQTLVIDDERKIKFSKEDVALVFGIPCNGRSVYEGAMPRKEVVSKILSFFTWNREKDNRSIKAALEVIERDYSGTMTDGQQSAFKVAFVIYIMSTLLSPGAKYDYASVDYWDALVEPSEIHTFDWSHYVIHRLFDAVLKVKSDLTLYNKVTSITGCCLFLQVLYLDSIDLGVMNMPHTSFPRVSQFKPDLMKSMILADTNNFVDEGSIFCFGKSKLRPPNEVCYYWAKVVDGDIAQSPCSEQVGLWRVASAVAGSVNLPSEVAGVLHFVVEEFVKDKCRCKSVNGIDFVAILLAVIEPFVRGFRYTTLTDCNAEVIGNFSCKSGIGLHPFGWVDSQSSSDSSVNSAVMQELDVDMNAADLCELQYKKFRRNECSTSWGLCHNENAPRQLSVLSNRILVQGNDPSAPSIDPQYALHYRCLAVKAMARYYLAVCLSKPYIKSCSQIRPSGTLDSSPEFHPPCHGFVDCKTPWDLGLRRAYAEVDLDLFGKDGTKSMKCIQACRIHHNMIVHEAIEVQLNGLSEIEMDLFDSATSHFKRIDNELYARHESNRWRHFVSSRFVESILAASFRCEDRWMTDCNAWLNPYYDVSKCKMVFFPALMEHRWICYAWDIDRNVIVVFDPLAQSCVSPVLEDLHRVVVKSLKLSMQEVVINLSIDWQNDWSAASTRFIKVFSAASCSSSSSINRSGVLCLQFCFSFDGTDESVLDRLSCSDRVFRTLHWDVMEFFSK